MPRQARLGAPRRVFVPGTSSELLRNRLAIPADLTPPTVVVSSSLTGTVTDAASGGYAYSFTADESIRAWKIKVVPSTTSPHTAGITLESGGAVYDGATVSGTISWWEFARAGYPSATGAVIKVFAQDLGGNWSDSPDTTAATFPSLLRVSDGVLVDENDYPVGLFKGFAIHVAPTIGGETFTWPQTDFTAIADAGGKIVRHVIHWDVFQKSAGVGGIDMTAVAALDSSISRAETVGMYSYLSCPHMNVSRQPAWSMTTGVNEWTDWLANGQALTEFLANRYGNPSSPQYTKSVIAISPNEPPTANYESLVSGYETMTPWWQAYAPNWLVWVAATPWGQGTPYPGKGLRIGARRYLRMDSNRRGVVFTTHDYFGWDPGTFGPYAGEGPTAPKEQAPGTYTAEYVGTATVYVSSDDNRADQRVYTAPWKTWLTKSGRFAFCVEEFSAPFTSGEVEYISDLVQSFRAVSGGPGTVAEIWWIYGTDTRAADAYVARPSGAWRQSVYGWLSNPDPPIPFSSLIQVDAVSRAEAGDTVSYSSIGTSSWSHPPNADLVQGVVVAILQPLASADEVSGVTYGGVALTRIVSYTRATGRVYLYVLGTGVLAGTQTVAVTSTGTAAKQAHCYTLTTGGRDVVVDSYAGGDLGTIANPSQTVAFTESLPSQVGIGAHLYGGSLPPSQTTGAAIKAGLIVGYAHDPGADTGETYYRQRDPETTSDVFGYDTLASDTQLIGAVVVKEQPPDTPIGVWENLITTPSGESGTAFFRTSGTTVTTPSGVAGATGTNAIRMTATGTGGQALNAQTTPGVEAGAYYTYLLTVLQIPATRTIRMSLDWKDSAGQPSGLGQALLDITATGTYRIQARAPANAFYVDTGIWQMASAAGEVSTVDAVLLAKGKFDDAYFDGSIAGASWTGTAHQSSSTRPV